METAVMPFRTMADTTALSFDGWNKDKTRRVNLHDGKRYPAAVCPLCNGSGYRWEDWWAGRSVPCSCRDGLRVKHTEASAGRSSSIAKYSLNSFTASEPWQETLLKAACEYARHPSGFLVYIGQAGSGKTHLAAGAFNHILHNGTVGIYRSWQQLTAQLKAEQNTPDYIQTINALKGCAVLYLDDFLQAPRKTPTAGDLKIAFEVINARYEECQKPTILTSNIAMPQLAKLYEPLAGRIVEAAGHNCFAIADDPMKDYRMKSVTSV